MINKIILTFSFFILLQLSGNSQCDCTSDQVLDDGRSACSELLSFTPSVDWTETNGVRMISSNAIPDHMVGKFGGGRGGGGPNAISEQSEDYEINANPEIAAILTPLVSATGMRAGPQYSFGLLFNGVELDPVAAEPFPHEGIMDPNVNWEWNLEALNIRIGLDCNNAHVQPTGKYHYHGSPTLFLEELNISDAEMTMIGYAADGFPIYYKYAYADPADATSDVIEMTSSYKIKEGCRPGDGVTAPCDEYNGVYTNDYEFVEGLGTLDEANGRYGMTEQYPGGTYYYVITDEFPSVPRYFRGTPSTDFKIGPNRGQGSCDGINGGDSDNDGICKIDDCNDDDANVLGKQPEGTACDDGDDLTDNDIVQADGCSCMGTKISTSTNEELEQDVKIYPNPTSEVLYLSIDVYDMYEIQLYDIQGKLLLQGMNLKSLEMGDKSNGNYLLKISDADSGKYIVKSVIVTQ